MLPAHLVLAAMLATAPPPKKPEVYATIPIEKKNFASDAHFSPDGKTLAFVEGVVGEDVRIVLWDVAKKERTAAFETKGSYREMVWSPDGKAIYAADLARVYRINVVTGKRAKLYEHDALFLTTLKYLPDTKQLVSVGMDGSIVIWDTAKDERVKELKLPEHALAVDAQPVPGTSKLVVTASNAILKTDSPRGIVLHGMSEANLEKIKENADKIGANVVIDSFYLLYVADVADGAFETALRDPSVVSDDKRQLAASHVSGEYAFADPEKGVMITNAMTGKSYSIEGCPIRPITCRFSPSDRYLFVGGYDKDSELIRPSGAIAVYDLTAEKWVAQWARKGVVSDLSYSAEANLLTCTSGSGADRQITVWDMKGVIDPAAKPKGK